MGINDKEKPFSETDIDELKDLFENIVNCMKQGRVSSTNQCFAVCNTILNNLNICIEDNYEDADILTQYVIQDWRGVRNTSLDIPGFEDIIRSINVRMPLRKPTVKNKVYLRRTAGTYGTVIGMLPQIYVFPVYCTYCHTTQENFYHSTGSRYGNVGSMVCGSCGSKITITDNGNMQDKIYINGEVLEYSQLYLLDWKYLMQIEAKCRVSVSSALSAYSRNEMVIDVLRKTVEKVTGITTDGSMRFVTDNRIDKLPDDINRWIELLYRAGIAIPAKRVQ